MPTAVQFRAQFLVSTLTFAYSALALFQFLLKTVNTVSALFVCFTFAIELIIKIINFLVALTEFSLYMTILVSTFTEVLFGLM